MSNKIHFAGTRTIGGQRMTVCNSYMAEGRWAVTTTPVPMDVTCSNCVKALKKPPTWIEADEGGQRD